MGDDQQYLVVYCTAVGLTLIPSGAKAITGKKETQRFLRESMGANPFQHHSYHMDQAIAKNWGLKYADIQVYLWDGHNTSEVPEDFFDEESELKQ